MNNPLVEGIDYYYNRQGLMVLTLAYLVRRGYCCGQGCLHCPYQYDQVPEPSKSQLLALRQIRGGQHEAPPNESQ